MMDFSIVFWTPADIDLMESAHYSTVKYSALQYSTVPDGVHDDVEQVRVQVWGLQVGTILVRVHLET